MTILEDSDSLCFWEEQNIICYVYKKPVLDLEMAKLAMSSRLRVTNNSPCVLLTDLTNVKSTTKEARAYYIANNTKDLVKAVALITPSILTKIMATFFINFDKPGIPVKMFTSREKAIEWLKELNLLSLPVNYI
jgi:hypothetical protein